MIPINNQEIKQIKKAGSVIENSLELVAKLSVEENRRLKSYQKGDDPDKYAESKARSKSLIKIIGRLQDCVDEIEGIIQTV